MIRKNFMHDIETPPGQIVNRPHPQVKEWKGYLGTQETLLARPLQDQIEAFKQVDATTPLVSAEKRLQHVLVRLEDAESLVRAACQSRDAYKAQNVALLGALLALSEKEFVDAIDIRKLLKENT